MHTPGVLGVDGCRGGWLAVRLELEHGGWVASPPVFRTAFSEILNLQAHVLCVDIPIGLPDGQRPRRCDAQARSLLGRPRASSVFSPPCRSALGIADYRQASAANFRLSGRRLNQQSFRIGPKILEVDRLMTPALQRRVLEAHPELAFRALNGGSALASRKRSPQGMAERWRLLRNVIPNLPPAAALPTCLRGVCATDDYVDAIAVAWTAARFLEGRATRVPAQPPVDQRGLRMEIWFPAT
jgi:predicted RNase H-like nuclease